MKPLALGEYNVAHPLVCHVFLCFSLGVASACLGSG